MRSRKVLLGLATLALGLGALAGLPAAQAAERALTHVAFVTNPPLIDGMLTDSVWRNAPALDLFVRLDDGRRPWMTTRGHLLWDSSHLYVGVRCEEPEMSQVVGKVERRDGEGIWLDDCLEVFVKPAAEPPTFHLIVNVLGALYDESEQNQPKSWDSKATARTSVGEAFWEAELRIPFHTLGGAPAPGDRWRMNLCRQRPASEELSSWSGVRGGSFHAPDLFGEIVFGGRVPVFTWATVGDEFGDLNGGAIVRGEVYNPSAVPSPVEIRVSAVEATGNVAEVRQEFLLGAYGVRPVSVPYRGKLRAPQALRVEVSSPAGSPPFLVSSRIILQPRFFHPRIDWLRARFEAALPGAQPEEGARLERKLQELAALASEIDAPKEPSAKRWNDLNARLLAIAAPAAPPPTSVAAAPVKPVDGAPAQPVAAAPAKPVAASPSAPPTAATQTASVPTAAPAPPRKAYLLFPAYPFERVLYDTSPRVQEAGAPISLFGCRSEREPGSFVISATRDLLDVSFRVSDLTGPAGTIPSRYVTLRVVKCWTQLAGGSGEPKSGGMVPELLLPDDRLALRGLAPSVPPEAPVLTDVPGGTSKQVWLTVQIPDKIAPGVYTGRVTVEPADHPAAGIDLQVRVLPFELPAAPQWLIMGHRATLTDNSGPTQRTEEQYARELKDMLDHGFRYASAVDQKDRLETCLDVRWRLGMSGVFPYCAGVADAKAAHDLRTALGRRPGWTLLVGPADLRLAGDDGNAKRQVGHVRAARGATVGLIAAAEANQLAPLVDLPVYSVTDPDFVPYLKAVSAGSKPHRTRELYAWDCTQEDPSVNRLFCGYYLHKSGLKGALACDYQRFPPESDSEPDKLNPYAEAAEGTRYPLLAYPSAEGPVPTIQWEAAREGLDDLRYVLLLDQVLAKASHSRDDLAPVREQAAAFLKGLRAAVQLDHVHTLKRFYPKRFQELRWEAVRLVLALTQPPPAPLVPAPGVPAR